MTARLVDTEAGTQVWAESFDRGGDQILTIQDEIARRVVNALRPRIASIEPSGQKSAPTENVDAYLAFLRGRALLAHWTIGAADAAEREFSTAIALDARFAAAYASLYDARLLAEQRRSGGASPNAGRPTLRPSTLDAARAKNAELIERALAIDPDSGAAHFARAIWAADESADREHDFAIGLARDPSNGRGITAYAEFLDRIGRRDEAQTMLERAIAIDPLSPRAYFWRVMRAFPGDASQIERGMLGVLEIDPDYEPALQRSAKYRWMQGEIAAGIETIEHALSLDPNSPWLAHTAVAMYLDIGDAEAARGLVAASNRPEIAGQLLLDVRDGDVSAAARSAHEDSAFANGMLESWGVFESLRDAALESHAYAETIGYIEKRTKLGQGRPVGVDNFHAVPLLAQLLLADGRPEYARELLRTCIRVDRRLPSAETRQRLRAARQSLRAALARRDRARVANARRVVSRGRLPAVVVHARARSALVCFARRPAVRGYRDACARAPRGAAHDAGAIPGRTVSPVARGRGAERYRFAVSVLAAPRARPARRASRSLARLTLTVSLGVAAARAGADSSPLEEIIVTARKVAEPLTSAAMTIDVLTANDLRESGADSLQGLVGRVPGFYYESTWGGLESAPTLRSQPQNPVGDVTVGVFVDGVYQANQTALDTMPIDLARIEVAHGPQSALFGHSTFAGAVHYVSRAPTEHLETGVGLDAGTDGYRGVSGYVSGPLADRLLGRIAIGTQGFDGTRRTSEGGEVGAWRRQSFAATLATPTAEDRFQASVALRLGRRSAGQPPTAALTYVDYNCGGFDAASRAWSYYCGPLPRSMQVDLSASIPNSEADTSQAALVLSWPVAGGRLESVSSGYRADVDAYRDFDASSEGMLFGVCTVAVNCPPFNTPPKTVDRFATANEVTRNLEVTREWSEELRFSSSSGARARWMVGVAFWRTTERSEHRFGIAREDLATSQRLTAVLPATPSLVGLLSAANNGLVADPNAEQVVQSLDATERRTLALFGAFDYDLSRSLTARAELRSTHEQRALDNVTANFTAGLGTALAPQEFEDVTPRASLRFAPTERWSGYASLAKGSQSGGINPLPGLPRAEQTYDPEYNWTYELGGRYAGPARRLSVAATAYYVDWRDAQLPGFSSSSTIANIITLNTAGITTLGLELSLDARPVPALEIALDASTADPQFRDGSDDLGSKRFCAGSGNTSSFCTMGPARTGAAVQAPIVPYIDGNVPARVPTKTWHAGFGVHVPPLHNGGHLVLRLDANRQGDVYERSIDGARFGARTLVDARLEYTFGAWSVQLWGRNLGDVDYVRAAASRGQVFFPTTPRPLDMIDADGRRIGISAAFSTPRPGG